MADRNAQEQRLFITGNEAVALAAMAGKKAFTCDLCQMVCPDYAIRIEKK